AVLLRLDRVVLARADDPDLADDQLAPSRRTRVGPDLARDGHTRLERQRVERGPDLFGDLFLQDHALHDAGPVPDDEERDPAVRAGGLDPSAHRDGLADVTIQVMNLADHGHTFDLACGGNGARPAPTRMKRVRKVDRARERVNLVGPLVFAVVVSGCSSGPGHLASSAGPAAPAPAPPSAPGAGPVLADSVDTAWRRRIGPSILSPLLVEDGIVVAATGGGRVVALEAATGERAWRRGVGGSVRAGLVRGGEWLLT